MLIDGASAKSAYAKMEADRSPYLERAKQVARLTLPHILTEPGNRGATLPTPYQSVGARGTSSLSSKLLMALFPPSQSFMRLDVSDLALENLGQGDIRAEVENSLAGIEQTTMKSLESRSLRPYFHECIKHLVIAGNVLLYLGAKVRVFGLDRFVLKRDPAGNLLCAIAKECVSPKMLSPEMQMAVASKLSGEGELQRDSLDIYTAVCRRDADTYEVWQEVCEVVIPESQGTYKEDDLPWIPLRMEPISGESYAYGYAASQLGDLASLEGLMKALVEASAASSRLVFLVSPTATTKVDQLNRCPNGGFVSGMPDDVVALKVDKAADMSVAFQAIERLTQSLGFAFLLNQSVQRSGERVTAEEIRFLAQELEDVLAGTYALLAQEFQLRVVKVVLKDLEKRKEIPKLPPSVKPVIVTGIEALGRGHDLSKLDAFVAGSEQILGPQVVAQYLNVSNYLIRRATALGLETKDLIRSQEEVQAQQAQAAQASMAEKVAPEAVRQIGNAVMQKPAQ